MNHHPQRLDVALTITWEAGWHVGSGQGTARVDRLLRRRACGPRGERAPFVPGSQIKGVLRHQCERLAAMLGESVVSPHVVSRELDSGMLDEFRPLAQSKLLIDRLFGSRFQGDCLFIEDAVPTVAGRQTPLLHSRTSIDRVTGTARDRTLFVTEVVPAGGPELHSCVRARHPVGALTQDGDGFPFEYSLLLAGLLSLDMLGGDKSAGLGKCRITITGETVRWNDRPDYSVAEALKSFADTEWFEMLQLIRGEGKA
jgi:CRISPR/Cas system CSM-associated protein Csm3 (group 7 of RAMP superfamily)